MRSPKENLSPELLNRPSLFDAVENYVIDHIEKPSED